VLTQRVEPGTGAVVPITTDATAAATEALEAKFQSYSDRADDLQKLIGVLVGLSSLYAVVLGLSSYVSAQSAQQALQKMESDATASLSGLQAVRTDWEKTKNRIDGEWKKAKDEIEKDITYSRRFALCTGLMALAMQGKHVDEGRAAIAKLKELRAGHPADPFLSFWIGRFHKDLEEYPDAERAMTVYLKEREDSKKPDDANAFAAHFNRACYRSLRWTDKTPVREQKEIELGVAADLQESFRLARDLALPYSHKEAFLDLVGKETDFTPVRNQGWFQSGIKL